MMGSFPENMHVVRWPFPALLSGTLRGISKWLLPSSEVLAPVPRAAAAVGTCGRRVTPAGSRELSRKMGEEKGFLFAMNDTL